MPIPRKYSRWNPPTAGDTRFAGFYVPRMTIVDPCPPVIEAHLEEAHNIAPVHDYPTFHRFQMTSQTRTRAGWDNPAKIDGGTIFETEFLPFWNVSPESEPEFTYIGGLATNSVTAPTWVGSFALFPQDGSAGEVDRPWRFSYSWRINRIFSEDSYLQYRFFPINDSFPS